MFNFFSFFSFFFQYVRMGLGVRSEEVLLLGHSIGAAFSAQVLVCVAETRNPKSETRNPKPETLSPKFETLSPKP